MMFNTQKQFGYGYLPGSNLLHTLTMPCNMTLTQSYETQRDLLIGMAYHRGSTLVTQRTYSYDTLGRPLSRSTARNGRTVNDSFVHNSRSELTGATVNGNTYGYAYDNIGNRNTATEGEAVTAYTANSLNQYTSIQENEEAAFVPTFDADGNQTLVKTITGIWSVEYNAENRPVRFTSADGATIIECSYDTHGRRATKKVTTNGSITLHQRYIYRGYLQLACCDLTRSGHPCLWLLTWDPAQPVATRPLAIRKDGTWYAYGWDLTKNICEVFGQHGYLRTAYTYSPYGEVTADGDVTQPIQWSSEYNDTELALVYYNYRHYNPLAGRWIGRDRIEENTENNLYEFVNNSSILRFDVLGMYSSETWTGMATENGYYTPNKKDEFIIRSLKTTPNPNMSNPTLIDQIQAYWNAFWNNVVEEYYGERGGNKVTSIDALKSNLKTKDKKCIKNLVFVAHGSKTDTKLDSVKIHMSNGEELKESRTSEQISDTFAATSYCKGCTIKLIVCNLGSSRFLKSRLESKTGCKITLYKNGVNPLFV